jgi:hypothetical protein
MYGRDRSCSADAGTSTWMSDRGILRSERRLQLRGDYSFAASARFGGVVSEALVLQSS